MREEFIQEWGGSNQVKIQIRHLLKRSFQNNPNIINEVEPYSKEFLEAYDDFNQKIQDYLNPNGCSFNDKRAILRHYFKWNGANNMPSTPITIRKINEYCVFLKEKDNRSLNRIKRTKTSLNQLRQALYKQEQLKINGVKVHEH